jgi:uncharacterized repeat protein (TIGR02543 family)
MDSDKSVTATFTEIPDPQEYTLSVSIVGSGSVTPEGGVYTEGTSVTLTATPATGYSFSSWSGDASGTETEITITMDSDKSVTATFVESGGEPCENPVTVTVPFSQDGVGEYCWVTSDDIAYVNSWNMTVVEVNGIDFTNVWSDNLPSKQDGNYYIYYQGDYSWSHFEVSGTKTAESIASYEKVILYPNPFTEKINIEIEKPENVQSITVFDQLGRIVQKYSKNEVSGFITIGHEFPKGVFYVNVIRAKGSENYIINKN